MSEHSIHRPVRFDRYTRISELGDALHLLLPKAVIAIALIILVLAAKLFLTDTPGWLALVFIGAGTCLALVAWQSGGIGLPLLPLLAVQHLVVYGVPLVNNNEIVAAYPESLMDQAGLEVLILLAVTAASWRFGMQVFRPSRPVAYALKAFVSEGNQVLNRVGIALIVAAAGYELAGSLGFVGAIMDILPSGTQSIVVAMVNAVGMSGYFLVAMFIASGEASGSTRNIFWCVLVAHLVLLTSSLLLSSVINIIGAVVIGLFWGSGKMPKRFLLICALILSFLNIGKFEMRDRYWDASDEALSSVGIAQLPTYYWEWIGYSSDKIFGNDDKSDPARNQKKQTLLSRVDNMQNLLFAINGITNDKITPLHGETYAVIPPLLIPRILWPEKPRTHEGQIMLNVHFGRQSRAESFTTYIAWGLLPEAYGNFGAIWGSVILGAVLGILFAWLENLTAAKPLLSLEGMVTFALFVGLASSFEMVSSVLVTSLFQSVITIAIACFPFVQRMTVIRSEDEPAPET